MTEEATQAGLSPDSDDNSLDALRRESEENWAKYLRAVAELDNLRKRSARELENAHKFGIERLAAALLPVRDSMEAALLAGENADATALLDGQRATLRLLDEAFASAGIREIDPQGEPFDPNRHEAISVMPATNIEPNSVLQVIQKGYELHERIVRPARVIVSREPDGESS